MKKLIYFNAFNLGICVMAFEMLASRHLYPVYGSGIDVWACLISVILLALMLGYYNGGRVADKNPSKNFLGFIIFITSIFILLSPFYSPKIINLIDTNILNENLSLFSSAIFIVFLPVYLLGYFTPYAIKLSISNIQDSGKISGSLYAVSTLGNIVGTLSVPFILIPNFGAMNSCLIIAVLCFLSALSFLFIKSDSC